MDLRDAYALAEHLLEVHGLHDWTVEFDSAKRRAGVYRFATRTLGLSAPLTTLHPEGEVRDTILHEIAHALVGEVVKRGRTSYHLRVGARVFRVPFAWVEPVR